MILRDAGQADAASIAALHAASWRDAYRGVLSDALLDGRLGAEMDAEWSRKLAEPLSPGAVLMAECDGRVAGFTAVWRRGDLAYIDNLHVRPGLRGGGIGPALLGEAARRLAAEGCVAAALHVFAANAGAIRLYRRLGAAVGPDEPVEVFGETVIERRCDWSDIAALIAACGARAAARPA